MGARRPALAAVRGVVAVSVVLAVGLTSCAGSPRAATPLRAGVPTLSIPLDTTLATPSATVAVVAMGTLRQPDNTFWQLFTRPAGATAWTLTTPPGVADNGGLVTGASGATPSLLVGFEPSQDLQFSPLAGSTSLGRSWAPGLLPAALAAVPDAVTTFPPPTGLPAAAHTAPPPTPTATSPTPSGSSFAALALVRAGGGEVLGGSGDISAWTTLVRRSSLASSPAGRACRAGRMTAVSLDAADEALVGSTCAAPDAVGIFGDVDGTWRDVGPTLRGTASVVLRLTSVAGSTDALVAVRGTAGGTSLVSLAGAPGGTWARSAPLALGAGDRIVSTGVGQGGGFVVVTSTSGRLAADEESGPAGAWSRLPTPPPGTAAVAVSGPDRIDALSVASVRFTDWGLAPAGDRWVKLGTVEVPIEFGSSS